MRMCAHRHQFWPIVIILCTWPTFFLSFFFLWLKGERDDSIPISFILEMPRASSRSLYANAEAERAIKEVEFLWGVSLGNPEFFKSRDCVFGIVAQEEVHIGLRQFAHLFPRKRVADLCHPVRITSIINIRMHATVQQGKDKMR